MTPLESSPADAMRDACLVCRIGGAPPCRHPVLRGEIVRVAHPDDDTWEIELAGADPSTPSRLELLGPWSMLAPRLQEACEARGPEERLGLVAYHLDVTARGLRAGVDSLVVLDPDWLIRVTDLTRVDFCPRQRLLDRVMAERPSAPAAVGNLVHTLFPHIWAGASAEVLEQRGHEALRRQAVELAQGGLDAEEIRQGAAHHVDRLVAWAAGIAGRGSEVRHETFLIAPAVGLKGKVDVLWERGGRPVMVGELKTGSRRAEHRLQITSYGLMLLSRAREALRGLRAILIHSKSGPGEIHEEVRLDLSSFRHAMMVRNQLLLVDQTGHAPFETHSGKCRQCHLDQDCARLAVLAGHPDRRQQTAAMRLGKEAARLGPAEAAFFQEHARALADELRAVRRAHAALWATPPEIREREGTRLGVAASRHLPGDPGQGVVYRLEAAEGGNRSEFRAGDRVLLSSSAGPTEGPLALASVRRARSDHLEVATEQALGFEPRMVDPHTDEQLVEREFRGLYQWMLRVDPLRDVVVQGRPPLLGPPPGSPPDPAGDAGAALNERQLEAIEKSLRTRDYLLVLGPPGSGKTTLIREMVRAHLDRGHRVLIAAGTNRALDQALRQVARAVPAEEILRLGDGVSQETLRPLTLRHRLEAGQGPGGRKALRAGLRACRVVGATTSHLLQGASDELLGRFDLVIVDEAAQSSVPATLGALRLGQRFVLIGDPHQLPPVRLHRGVAQGGADPRWGRGDSLFERLQRATLRAKADGLVVLSEQYRMNAGICALPARLWYGEGLRPASEAVSTSRLCLAPAEAARDEGEALVARMVAPGSPVTFVDLPASSDEGPRVNLEEAAWAARIVGHLMGRGSASVGVVAPFRAQVAAIRRLLETEWPGREEAIRDTVDTVDRFQGDERDAMVVSLTTTGDFVHPLLLDARRLNVAITRARKKLILLGSRATLSRAPLYRGLLGGLEESGASWVDVGKPWASPSEDAPGAREEM